MYIKRKKQSQFELFPGSAQSNAQTGNPPPLTKDLTLSLENIIVLCITIVMVCVLLFSFGVERGKRLTAVSETSQQRTSHQRADSKEDKRVVQKQERPEERVIFPVEVPREVFDERQPAVQPPLEKNEEQENLFTIQVASFKLEKNAQKEADRLKETGHDDAFVVPKGSYSIVCVGKFPQREEAKKLLGKLKRQYNDLLVRRL